MKSGGNQLNLRVTLLLLVGMTLLAGCLSLGKWESDIGTLVDERNAPFTKLGRASMVYYRCCGKWPSSVAELRSADCADAEMRQEISNILAAIQWNTVTNLAFKTTSEGDLTNLTISMDLNAVTLSTNGTSMSFGAASISTVLSVPKSSE